MNRAFLATLHTTEQLINHIDWFSRATDLSDDELLDELEYFSRAAATRHRNQALFILYEALIIRIGIDAIEPLLQDRLTYDQYQTVKDYCVPF